MARSFLKILAVFVWLLPLSATASDASCAAKWAGTWQLSAEGQPVEIFNFKQGESQNELAGVSSSYSGGAGSFYEAVLTTKKEDITLSKASCNADVIMLEISTPNGEKSSYSAKLVSSDEGWFTITDLPAGYVSPKYLFRKVPPSTKLEWRKNKTRTVSYDLWGQETIPSNQEMAEIFKGDQAIRLEFEELMKTKSKEDNRAFFERWTREDQARFARTTELLESGQLKAGVDYYRAAFVFQHGDKPSDYLRAHHLAVIALSLGYKQAKWISAATLDRYLMNIGQQQIYGTQYSSGKDGIRTQPAFDKNVVSDPERKMLSVPLIADQ